MKNFSGKILFLDRSDINTDEIIPAKYLTELTKAALKPYCLEDLSIPGFDPKKDIAGKSVIITRANFGCGSSREHAPWVLECNDINLVIAENFARIFRQNMFNCGLMAVQMDAARDCHRDQRHHDCKKQVPAGRMLQQKAADQQLQSARDCPDNREKAHRILHIFFIPLHHWNRDLRIHGYRDRK